MQAIFRYHPEILYRYPNLRAGVILADEIHNSPTPEPLREAYINEQKAVLASIGQTALSEIPSLAGWRTAYRKFGVDPTQYRSSAEALLRRLTKKGDIPCINTLVDLANLVSIRYAFPVAAFDLRHLNLPITVCFANGTEHYTPLGEENIEFPIPGEVIFADQTDLVIARRWCHRQSDESAAKEDTRRALFTIEGQHEGCASTIEQAIKDLQELIQRYAGGDSQTALLP
jgi:DNA/RNA-binding domain of Phe-tRNA-synthetase-like protein